MFVFLYKRISLQGNRYYCQSGEGLLCESGWRVIDRLFLFFPSVYHPVSCSYCRSNGMTGFRYRCLRCRGYQLCQNCFWRGNTSGSHNSKHQMKEHSSWVSQAACDDSFSSPGGPQRVLSHGWSASNKDIYLHFTYI